MKNNLKNISLATIIWLIGTAVMTSCQDDKGKGGNIPDDKSTFWSDAYRQHQLNGKVKSVKTRRGDRDFYNYLEFDQQGNLLKNVTLEDDNPGYYYGLVLTYDGQNRLTKAVYGDNEEAVEVAEFGYDGSHSAYIPTNIYSMEDLRLQKGVTSVKYQIQDREPLMVSCKEVSGNRIIFEGTAGALATYLGDISRLEVECSGAYPAHIRFLDKTALHSEADVTFGSDGMPTKVTYTLKDDEKVITEYTSAGGFLLMVKQYEESDPDDCNVYRYNDKGIMEGYTTSLGAEYRFLYQYDAKGNWTQKEEEYRYSSGGDWEQRATIKREYTYWN